MEKYKVLEKFFQVAEQIKKEKEKFGGVIEVELSKKTKLSASAKSILRLLLLEETVNQRTIAKTLHISSQAVSETIKKLELYGLVTKSSGTINNENFIMLTKLGEKMAIQLEERIKNHANEVFREFTKKEIEDLYVLLDKILKM
ncbi:MAG: winged helix-turn-helix transcriptional regulator [Eubacteriales bacterium]